MRKFSFILITLLLVSIVGMVEVIPVDASSTEFYVIPSDTIDDTLQPEPPVTVKPMADGTFKDWTWNTTTIRPNQEGTYSDWTGRILTLNPNGHGIFGKWNSWVHLTPNVNGIHTNWTGTIADWDDWPTPDGDSSVRTTTFNNYNESSGFWDPPPEPRTLGIVKVRLTIVARQTNGTYPEQIRLMLVIGGSMYNGSLVTPGTSYSTFTTEWSTNPAVGGSWQWSQIDLLEGGVRSQQVGATFDSQLRVTQIYASVLTGGVYTQWDDWPVNNTNTDYVFATANVGGQSSALPNHSSETWAIAKVRVTIVAQANTSDTDDTMAVMVVVNGKSYNSTYFTPSTAFNYTEYSFDWTQNPRWNIPWNWTAIDALEVGVNTKQVKNTWTGEFRVTQIYVKVIEAGSYTLWNEAAPDEDNSYVSTIFPLNFRSSQLENHGSESWSIARVQVSVVAGTDVPTDEKLQIMIVVDGKMYNSSSFTPTTTYSTYTKEWLKNPRYGAGIAWNWTAIDNLQAGVKSVKGTNEWIGELRVTQLYVVVGSPGTYTEWDDWPDYNEGDYVSATANLMKESSQLENPVRPAWSIARVRVVIYARATVTTDELVSPMVVVGGLEYPGTPLTLSTTYAKYTTDWGKNPVTGKRWTWDNIDALEAGVQATVGNDKIWTGEIRVTQMYVEVACLKFSVDLKVENVIDLYTVDFRLNYTTAVLTATAIFNGSFWNSLGAKKPKIWAESIDDASGSLRWWAGMPLGWTGPGISGTGVVAIIDFTVDFYGYSSLDLNNVKFWDRSSIPITPIDVYDGYFSNKLLGDVNGDKTVGKSDLVDLSDAYGSDNTMPNWNEQCDFNRDKNVTVLDLFDLSKNYGKTSP